jgi:protein gp37
MNKSKIEWCDFTWNPVTGCLHGCEYCYAQRIAKRFESKVFKEHKQIFSKDCTHDLHIPMEGDKGKEPYPYGFQPTFHRYRLDEPQKLKKPSKIFVVSMGDLFGDWVPVEWIEEVFKACEAAPQHTYMFLTKNFLKASDFRYRDNWWIGRTITNKEDSRELCTGDPWNIDRIHRANHFLSIEPLLGDVEYLKYYLYSFKWVIIGAQTGPGAKPPKPEWVQSIIDQCRVAGVPVFLKSNLNWPEKIQEFPEVTI